MSRQTKDSGQYFGWIHPFFGKDVDGSESS